MHRIIPMCLDAAIAAVLFTPVFWMLNKYHIRNTKKAINYFILAVYYAAVFAVAGLPDIRYIRFDPHFNFSPFAYMFSDYENSLLNVLLFVPLGFLLPVYWKPFQNALRTFLFGFTASLLIEVLQIFTYRASDVNDLMTNTLGTVVGWLLARLLLHTCPQISSEETDSGVYLVSGTAFAVMFLIHPFAADWIWMYF